MNAARFFHPHPVGEGRGEGLRPSVPLLVLVLVLVLACPAPAAAPSLAWAARDDGGQPVNRHAVLDLLRSPAGHLVVGGTVTRTNGQTAYVAAAFNEQGQTLWRTEHVSTNQSENTLRRIIQDQAGHLLLTGTSDTLKLSPAGQVLWIASHGGRDVAADTNGHAYLTGYRTDDIALLKLDATAGTNVWERLHDGPVHLGDLGRAVSVDQAQDVYVLGSETWYVDMRGGQYQRLALARYSLDGFLIWYRSPLIGNTIMSQDVRRMLPAPGGGVVFSGNLSLDFDTYSILPAGVLAWRYASDYDSRSPGITAMVLSPNGEIIMTGGDPYGDYPNTTFISFALESDGRHRWQARHPVLPVPQELAGGHAGRAVTHDPQTGLDMVTGIRGLAWGVTTIATVAYEHATGRELWHQYYPGPVPGHHEGMGVAVDGRGAVYVAGHSDNAAGGRDLLLLKYVPAAAAAVTPAGDVAVTIPAAPGTPVTLEATTDFAAWSSLGTALAGTNAAARFTDTNAVNRFPRHFYRPRP